MSIISVGESTISRRPFSPIDALAMTVKYNVNIAERQTNVGGRSRGPALESVAATLPQVAALPVVIDYGVGIRYAAPAGAG